MLVGGGIVLTACVVLAVLYPRLSLLTLVALDVSNINGVIADHIGVSPYKPQLALAAFILLVMARRKMFRISFSPVLLGLLILFAGFCLSFVAAADPITAQDMLIADGRDILYFVVVFALILSTDQVKSVPAVAVLVLAAIAGLTVLHEFVLHNSGDLFGLSRVPLVQEGGALTPRHAGTSSDVNFWARLLILFTPMSLSLFAMSKAWLDRVLWAGCTVALLVGIYLTQSRGGFIALFVGVLVWALLAGGRYRKSLFYVPLALLVLVPLTGIGSRLATLIAITSDPTGTADPSVITRKRLQVDAWQMFLDRPVTGHGIGSYGVLFPSYDRVADYYQPVDIVVAAHNFYLEQAADGGIVLLLAWALFFGSVLFSALRSLLVARRQGNDTHRFLAIGVIGGIAGWLVASVFLHLSDFRALLLLAAMVAALDVQTRQRTQPAAPPDLSRVRLPTGRAWVLSFVAISVLSACGLVTVWATSEQTYSNSATLAVTPSSTELDPSTAYQLDVVSRGLIVPTLATVLDASISVADLERQAAVSYPGAGAAISVTQSRLGGAIVVTVTASQEQAASDLGGAAVTLSKTQVSALQPGYQLTGTMAGPETVSAGGEWLILTLEVTFVLTAGLAALAGRRRAVSPSPSADPVLAGAL